MRTATATATTTATARSLYDHATLSRPEPTFKYHDTQPENVPVTVHRPRYLPTAPSHAMRMRTESTA
jgi:hypothetical protein